MDSQSSPMLQALTLPASWRMLLENLRPVFARSSTFGLFVLLATGLVARTARRTVVGMLAGAGMAALVSFHLNRPGFDAHLLSWEGRALPPACGHRWWITRRMPA